MKKIVFYDLLLEVQFMSVRDLAPYLLENLFFTFLCTKVNRKAIFNISRVINNWKTAVIFSIAGKR